MATGYTRQAAGNIVNGGTIDAADFNSEYNQIEAAFSASTGHTHDGTTGGGAAIESLGPSQDVVATATVFRPKTTNTVDLGTTTLQFKDAFFDGTLTTDLLVVDKTSVLTGNATFEANATVEGNLIVEGNTTLEGDITLGDGTQSTDTVTLNSRVASSLVPSTTNANDLGSSSLQWRNLYVDGQAEIDDLVADTADINGGTIDGATIGATTPAAITGTTITGTSVVGPLTGDVTGNADTATALQTARTFSLTGDVTAAATSFDGTGNVTLATTFNATASTGLALGDWVIYVSGTDLKFKYNGTDVFKLDTTGELTVAQDIISTGTV